LGSALLVKALGGSEWGMAIAGAGAMTSPYLSVWLLHPHGSTYVWLPWLLLSIEKKSHWAVALTTSALLMGGHPQTALHALGFATLWWVWRSRQWMFVLSLFTGCCLSAPIIGPFIEEVIRSTTLAHHGNLSLNPAQLFDLIWPGWHGHPTEESWTLNPMSWSDGRLHPGLGVLSLGLWSLFRQCRLARGLIGIWLLAIVAAVWGLPGPINDARLGSMGALFMCLSAGIAPVKRWAPLAFGLVVSTGIWAGWNDQGSLSKDQHDPKPAPWTQKLAEHVGDGRVIGLGWALQPNTGALVGLSDLRGYDLPVSEDAERLQMALNPFPVRPWFRIDEMPQKALLRFSSVRAVVSPNPLPSPLNLGDAPLFAQSVEQSMPRAWLATGARLVRSPDQSINWLKTDPDAPSRPPVEALAEPFGLNGRIIEVNHLTITTRTVEFSVDAPQKGIAVIADAWHPGWHVEVDGKSAQSLRVGGVFRGVLLAAGQHHVRWRFTPRGWSVGWFLFLLGMVSLFTPLSITTWDNKNVRDRPT
jgi:hypothetical protein